MFGLSVFVGLPVSLSLYVAEIVHVRVPGFSLSL